MTFILFISFVIMLRLAELVVAKSNEKWLLQNGAIEHGRSHYPVMVTLHVCFLLSLIVEYYCSARQHEFNLFFLLAFGLCIGLKTWVIATLGKYWNTRIYRIPNVSLVSEGPYKIIKHPNYVIVVAEIAIIPLVFQLYYTAVLFSLLNAAMLYVRIGVENKALDG